MIFSIFFALALAKLKGYKLRPLLKAYSIYPFMVLTIILIYLQVCIFFHNYTWIKYAQYIKSVYLFSLVIPFLVYKLYKPGLIGALLIILGTFLNKLVMSQNGGRMPVYATLSKVTGYYSEAAMKASEIHVIGDSSTKLKFLADYIDIGYSVLSIGDVLIHSFVFIILFYVIRMLNTKQSAAHEN